MMSEKAKIAIKNDFFTVCQDILTSTTKPGDVDRVIYAMYRAGLGYMVVREVDNIEKFVKITIENRNNPAN